MASLSIKRSKKNTCTAPTHPGSVSVEEVLCQDLDTLGDELQKFCAERMQIALDQLLRRISSFVHDTQFNHLGFISKTDDLQALLLRIEESYHKYVPSEIEFIKLVLLAMLQTARLVECSKDVEFPGHESICKISELIFRIYLSHYFSKSPSLNMSDGQSKMREFASKAEYVVKHYKNIKNVPIFIDWIFWDKVSQLKAALQNWAFGNSFFSL